MAAEAWRTANQHIDNVTRRTTESAEREWLIGQVFASAYRVDLHDSTFERAEQHLRRAMQLDSLFAAPRLSLAQMYVNANPTLAPTAEALLRGTRTRPRTPESLAVHEGLAFALYYQGQVAAAGKEASLAVAEGSTNSAMATMMTVSGAR
jgi:predicted Zn-dependent protease